jgi:GEVED domain/Secretion system C-terminal sorting domain/SprB repeat
MSNFTLYKLYVLTLCFFSCLNFSYACGYSFVGDGSSTVGFTTSVQSTNYFISNTTATYFANFNNANLGTGLTTLKLSYGESRTWESCANVNDVREANVLYRIYTNPASRGAFQSANLTEVTQLNNPPYRVKTRFGTLATELLTGLQSSTTYFIEVVMQVKIDTDGNGAIDAALLNDKDLNGNITSYIATFQTGLIAQNGGFPVTVATTNPTCGGGTNGTAAATPTGGKAPFTYKWSNNATTPSVSGLIAGNYAVTVTDSIAATGIRVFTISSPTAVTATITSVNAGCGLSTGTATAVASGGTAPYTYLWSTAATTATVTSLAPNTYTLTIKDSKNCTGTASTIVGENCGGGGTYCTSSATSPWQEWISRVKFGSIDNPSVKSPYSDFTTLRANINTGAAYNFSVTSEFSYATTVYGWKVWIDYNKNGLFEEPSEVVYSKLGAPPIPNAAYTLTAPVIIPAAALAGVTRMRVAMKLGALPTPCETIPNGEVEDYSVNIISGGGNTCGIIAQASNIVCNDNGTATNPADDTYTFSLNVTGTGTKWQTIIGATTIKGVMNTPTSFGPYPISGGTLNFTVRDSVDATCLFATSVDAPAPCSNGNVAPGSYCASQATTPWFDWIDHVKFGSINNPSVKSPYSNFTSQSTVVAPSASIPIRITAGFGYASPAKSVKVWIDYNRNGTFDATEVAFTGTIAAPTTGDTAGIAGVVAIPSTATQGTTRMRVALKAGAVAATPCETIPNGEVEDYTIMIAAPAVPLIGRTGSIRREVLELDAAKTPESVQVIWATNSSRKNALFILERSADGKIFSPIYQISAFKTTDELVDYHFEDKQALEGANYYRLRLIYLDNSETTTKPIFVQMDSYTDFALFPNPATEGVAIDVKKWLGKAVTIDISDNSGYVVFTQKLDAQHNRLHTLDVNNLASGSYFVRLTAQNQRPLVKKLMILK